LKIKEDEAGGDDMAANIVTLLQFLKNRSEESQSSPKISTDSFIKLVQNTGYKNFGYDDLVAANEIPTVKNLIKSFNEHEVVINLRGTTDTTSVVNKRKQDPESTVKSMANRAASV